MPKYKPEVIEAVALEDTVNIFQTFKNDAEQRLSQCQKQTSDFAKEFLAKEQSLDTLKTTNKTNRLRLEKKQHKAQEARDKVRKEIKGLTEELEKQIAISTESSAVILNVEEEISLKKSEIDQRNNEHKRVVKDLNLKTANDRKNKPALRNAPDIGYNEEFDNKDDKDDKEEDGIELIDYSKSKEPPPGISTDLIQNLTNMESTYKKNLDTAKTELQQLLKQQEETQKKKREADKAIIHIQEDINKKTESQNRKLAECHTIENELKHHQLQTTSNEGKLSSEIKNDKEKLDHLFNEVGTLTSQTNILTSLTQEPEELTNTRNDPDFKQLSTFNKKIKAIDPDRIASYISAHLKTASAAFNAGDTKLAKIQLEKTKGFIEEYAANLMSQKRITNELKRTQEKLVNDNRELYEKNKILKKEHGLLEDNKDKSEKSIEKIKTHIKNVDSDIQARNKEIQNATFETNKNEAERKKEDALKQKEDLITERKEMNQILRGQQTELRETNQKIQKNKQDQDKNEQKIKGNRIIIQRIEGKRDKLSNKINEIKDLQIGIPTMNKDDKHTVEEMSMTKLLKTIDLMSKKDDHNPFQNMLKQIELVEKQEKVVEFHDGETVETTEYYSDTDEGKKEAATTMQTYLKGYSSVEIFRNNDFPEKQKKDTLYLRLEKAIPENPDDNDVTFSIIEEGKLIPLQAENSADLHTFLKRYHTEAGGYPPAVGHPIKITHSEIINDTTRYCYSSQYDLRAASDISPKLSRTLKENENIVIRKINHTGKDTEGNDVGYKALTKQKLSGKGDSFYTDLFIDPTLYDHPRKDKKLHIFSSSISIPNPELIYNVGKLMQHHLSNPHGTSPFYFSLPPMPPNLSPEELRKETEHRKQMKQAAYLYKNVVYPSLFGRSNKLNIHFQFSIEVTDEEKKILTDFMKENKTYFHTLKPVQRTDDFRATKEEIRETKKMVNKAVPDDASEKDSKPTLTLKATK